MDSDSEEPPSKRYRYERSSTPIREADPREPPLLTEDGGNLVSREEPIAPAPVVESDTEQGDTLCPEDVDDPGPDYFGLSDEAMGK